MRIQKLQKKKNLNKDKVIKPSKKNSTTRVPIWLSSVINKFKRTSSKKGLKVINPLKLIKEFLGWQKRALRIVAIVVIIAVIMAGSSFIKIKYDQIQPQSLFDSESNITSIYNNKTQNILYINFEEGIGANLFAKYLSILTFNKTNNDLKILSVEPALSIYYKNKNYTFETLFNNINENNVTKIANFQNLISNYLGIRIDGYIAVNNKSYSDFILNQNLGMNLNESFKINNKFYKAGDYISNNDLVSYLNLDNSQENGSYITRKNAFLIQLLQNNRNLIFSFSNFFNWEVLANTFKTNLDKDSYIRFYNNIFFEANLPIQIQSILSKDGYAVETIAGPGIYVNQIDLDNKVQVISRDLDIVKEQAKIEVLNASRTPGLATVTKRIIQNSGGNVVNSGNYSSTEENTTLYLVDSKISDYANTIAFLKSIYPNLIISEKEYKYNKLGNLILVLGSEDN